MKDIKTYIIESEEWYTPFLKAFQKCVRAIMYDSYVARAGDVDFNQVNKMKVSKIGSKGSPVFSISYKNTAGVTMSYDFAITPPEDKNVRVGAVAGSIDWHNSTVEHMCKLKSSKLHPDYAALKWDQLGNIKS